MVNPYRFRLVRSTLAPTFRHSKDICPHTGQARLDYDRARVLPDQCTRTPTAPGWACTSSGTRRAAHLGEANAGLQLIMAKGRWRTRTVMRYVKPDAVALAEVTELLDTAPPRRG
jgi:integrase/recombinase XerC